MAVTALLTDSLGQVVLDMSDLALSKSYTPRLNLPGTGRIRIASQHLPDDLEDGGYRVKMKLDGAMTHNGLVWAGSDDGDENAVYTEFTSIEPTVLYGKRPARDADGDFSNPSFIETFSTGPQILEALHDHSVTYEGALPFSIGTVATGGADLSGAPTDWPMTIQEIASLLTGTGELDMVFVPVDGGASMGTLDLHNGDFGTDLTASVVFEYATGAFNVRRMQRSWSMADVCNKLFFYLGPRVLTSADPGGDQHWSANITGDDSGLPNPPGGDVDYANPLGDLVNLSRDTFGVMMDIRVYDGQGAADLRALYRRLWQTEQLLRAWPKRMLSIAPIRGLRPEFGVGDLVKVNAGTRFRGGFSNAVQRVYAYTVTEDENGVVSIDSIVTSADQEAV